MQDLVALKAQLQALQIEVDAIRQHLNLPSAASAVAAAATVADAPVERAQIVPSTVPNGRSRFAEGSTRISQVNLGADSTSPSHHPDLHPSCNDLYPCWPFGGLRRNIDLLASLTFLIVDRTLPRKAEEQAGSISRQMNHLHRNVRKILACRFVSVVAMTASSGWLLLSSSASRSERVPILFKIK